MKAMNRELFNKKFNEAPSPDAAMFLIKLQNDHLLALVDDLVIRVTELEAGFTEDLKKEEKTEAGGVNIEAPVENEAPVETPEPETEAKEETDKNSLEA